MSDDRLERANVRINELRKEVTAKLKQVGEKEALVATLQQQLHERDKALSSATTRHEEQMRELKVGFEAREQSFVEQEKALQQREAELDSSKVAFEVVRTRQQKEMQDMRAQVEQWQQAVESIRSDNDQIRLESASRLSELQNDIAAAAAERSSERANHAAYVVELQSIIESQQRQLEAHEDMIQRHILSIRGLEGNLMSLREEKESLIKQHAMRVEDMAQRHEAKVKELTNQYLALTNETHRIVSEVKAQTDSTTFTLETLTQWSKLRENIEMDNRQSKEKSMAMKKELEKQIRYTQKLEKDMAKETALLKDNINTLTQDRDAIRRELDMRTNALKLYKSEHEQKKQSRLAEEEKARQAQLDTKKSTQPSLANAFTSLFSSKKSINPAADSSMGAPPRIPTQHPAAQVSGAGSDKAFLDLEEEMAVALTDRVEKLEEEKIQLEEQIKVTTRELEQERVMAALLRQQVIQLGGERALDASTPSKDTKDRIKRDKQALMPENTSKVLADAIARNRELEELRRDNDKEIKKLKAQLDVKKAELLEMKRTHKALTATQLARVKHNGSMTNLASQASALPNPQTESSTTSPTSPSQ